MKLYYLLNKRKEKLRSLKELIDEFDSLVDLTDFTEDDGVASIRACESRWIGHLVKTLQCTIKKIGIYLTDLEKLKGESNKITT